MVMDTSAILFALQVVQALLAALAGAFLLWLIFLGLPAVFNGPPYVGSQPAKVAVMLKLADLMSGETVVDLGSGDGRLLLAAARLGCRAVGYEINLFLVWFTRLQALAGRLRGRVDVRWSDFWRADLSEADVVFVYGFSDLMEKIRNKLRNELKPGARVVSLRYELPGWTPREEADGVRSYLMPTKNTAQ